MASPDLKTPPHTPARLGDRSLFPHLEARAYLNHAGIGPVSVALSDAVNRLLVDYARYGVGAFPIWLAQRMRLRRKLAEMIGVSEDCLAFTQSTTAGIIDVALCFPWKPGDRVILFEGEFPANITPWQRAAALFGCEVVLLPLSAWAEDDARGIADLDRELARGARLVAVSAVQFQTGLRMPIGAIAERCHAHGAEIFVDAVQAAGVVPIDAGAAGIDYLACGAHKWLLGIEGAGFLYIHPDRVAALRPNIAGWLSHEAPLDFLHEGPGRLRYDRPIRKSADFLQVGNLSAAGFAGLEASVDCILDIGVGAIFEHVSGYLDALEIGLVERGFSSLRPRAPHRRSGILGVLPSERPDLSVVELQRELSTRGVACAIPDGVLRFAPHWPNHPDEIPHVLAAMDESIATLASTSKRR